jgi:hypothetical protein
MQQVNPQYLADSALEYTYLESCGFDVFGSMEGPFVIKNATDNSLLIFRADDDHLVEYMTFSDPASMHPFDVALKYSASFSVKDGVVTCSFEFVTGIGLTYCQAAMRAVIMFNQKSEREQLD